MKERPILFSAPMVRAILAGKKTQTRRVVKPRKDPDYGCELSPGEIAGDEHAARLCPYGQPGDRLWVREAWGIADKWLHDCETDPPRCIAYRANRAARNFDPVYDVDTSSWAFTHMKWRPSIHMPRWASRITLEVTGVRVERLRSISIEDAKAEGAWPDVSIVAECAAYFCTDVLSVNPRMAFRMLWERINGGESWIADPWVWVVEFKRVQVP